MKKIVSFAMLMLVLASSLSTLNQAFAKPNPREAAKKQNSFYNFSLKSIDGQTINFSRYKGKKVLLVNVASKCGFTPQYEELEKLHKKYGAKLVILGFPANDFMGQEPGTNAEIKEFCKQNYGVSFQMFEKITVKGENQHPLYQWLSKKELNGWNDKAPSWNFTKYLVNEQGELVQHFAPKVKPLSDEVIQAINK